MPRGGPDFRHLSGQLLGARQVPVERRHGCALIAHEPPKRGLAHALGDLVRAIDIEVGSLAVRTLDRGDGADPSGPCLHKRIPQALGHLGQLVSIGNAPRQGPGDPRRDRPLAEHHPKRALVPGAASQRERLVNQRRSTWKIPTPVELYGELDKELCARGGVVRGHDRECGLHDRDALLVDLPIRAGAEAAGVRQGGGCEPIRIGQLARRGAGVEQCLAEGGLAGLALRLAQVDEHVAPLARCRVGLLLLELQSPGEPPQRLVRSQLVEGAPTCAPGIAHRLGDIDRLGRIGPVARQLAQPRARIVTAYFLEGLCDALVNSRSSCPPESLVERVRDERVREREASRHIRRLHQHGRRDRLVEEVEQLVLLLVDHTSKEVDVEVPSDHRRHGERLGGISAESLHTAAHHLTDALRQSELGHGPPQRPAAVGVLVDGPRLGEVAEQFRDIEGVSIRLAEDLVRERQPGVVQLVARPPPP